MKLDKKAHAAALKLHQKKLGTDPEYRKAWDNLIIQMFSELADAELPEGSEQTNGMRETGGNNG
jgi:hypothetical protein